MKTYTLLFVLLISFAASAQSDTVVLKNATLIDGTGAAAQKNVTLLIANGSIISMAKDNKFVYSNYKPIDMTGKYIMPTLISAHSHIGTLKDTTTKAENYTRENILRQLKKYEDYGVSAVMVMGTDRQILFNGLRDSARDGLLPGARIYTAGYGFGAPNGMPPTQMGMDNVFRPKTAAEIPAMMDTLVALKPDLVKIWVDDNFGKFTKMQPEVYTEIINEAHKNNLRVAAHLYYLEDAKKLVAAGLDIIAHSIRDKDINDSLLAEMKAKGVVYIPTLSLDEFAFIYARKPDWLNDEFFKASLEPHVYKMITSEAYQNKIKNDPTFAKNMQGFATALRNLKRIYKAGILVALGTDSGATPIRAQGFSEHHELDLLVQAGLTPLEAITVATLNAAKVLHIDNEYGSLQPGKIADFIVLTKDPTVNIKNTRSIEQVWKAGVRVK